MLQASQGMRDVLVDPQFAAPTPITHLLGRMCRYATFREQCNPFKRDLKSRRPTFAITDRLEEGLKGANTLF